MIETPQKIDYYSRKLSIFDIQIPNNSLLDLVCGKGLSCDRHDVRRMSSQDYRQIIQKIIDLTGDEAVGLRLGEMCSFGDLGVLGYAALSSKTVRDAGQVMVKFGELDEKLLNIHPYGVNNKWIIEFHEKFPLMDASRFAVEEYAARVKSLLSQLIGRSAKITEIHFSFEIPKSIGKHEALFLCPIFFGSSKNLMVIDAKILDESVSFFNEEIHQYFNDKCRESISLMDKSILLKERIINFLAKNIGENPSITTVASSLGVSVHSLRRKLMDEGESYRSILDEVKKNLSIDYLANTTLAVKEIAFRLGYRDTSNFRRAFKSWTGLNTSDLRRHDKER